ncbi:hypothetical protein K439DRAFT_1346331, partial [Ramaria rubella]
VKLTATADGGAMMNAIDVEVWQTLKHRLGKLTPSQTQAKMANGAIVPSQGRWVGYIALDNMSAIGGFKVLESAGAFELLLGKPWLALAGLTQDFDKDTLHSVKPDGTVTTL